MRYYIFILLSTLLWPVMAQKTDKFTDAMLFGDVKDAETGEHLPYVNILIKGNNQGTSTNATGHYMFHDLPIGEVTLIASAIGYKSQSKTVITKKGESITLYFVLESDAIMTEQVVVTASRNEVKRSEAPVIVSAISAKHFQAIESTSMADGLNFTPGLRVENNCQNCGFTQLRMNGLEGAYSQILINSRPIFSTLAGVYGLEQIPTELVERIEVIRGGGSAIFGGSAIAGTVNIITKDPINNTFQISTKWSGVGIGVPKSGEMAHSKQINFNGALLSDSRKTGLFMFGSLLNSDPWDANNDSFSEIGLVKNSNFGFQTFIKPNNFSRINAEYHYMHEYRRGGDRFDALPHETNIAEMVEHSNHSGGLSYELYTNKTTLDQLSVYVSGQSVDRNSYYGANQDPNAYGYTTGLTVVGGIQYISNFDKWTIAPGSLVMGIENVNDQLNDKKLGTSGLPNSLIAKQMVNTTGAYAQYQIKYSRFKILLGARLDHFQINDFKTETQALEGTAISPRGNVLFDITEHWQLRASYSTGYRAPQIFDEDLHIESSGARTIRHINDPNLDVEHSNSVSASVRHERKYGRWQTEWLIEGFFTRLSNPFITEYAMDTTGIMWATRTNASDGAEVYGSNIEITLSPSRRFYTQIGGTLQAGKYQAEQQWGEDSTSLTTNILRTPSAYGYLILNYDLTKHFTSSLSGNYTGSMWVPHFAGGQLEDGSVIDQESLLKSENFYVLNLKLAYNFSLNKELNMELTAGVNNILNSFQSDFDYGVNRDAGYNYGPIKPRTLFFGLKIKM